MRLYKKLIEKLYLHIDDNLVYYDSVTKCKTRFYYDTVAKPRYQKKECCVIFVDVDGLKKINDTRGHSYGTHVIRKVGNSLLGLPKIQDVCRIGGDEFVIFAHKDFDITKLESIKGVSYGCYLKELYEDVSSAVSKADDRMYEMKKSKFKGQGRE